MNHWSDSGIIPGEKMSTTEPSQLHQLQYRKMEALTLTVSVWTSAIPICASTSYYSKDNEKEKLRGAIEQQVLWFPPAWEIGSFCEATATPTGQPNEARSCGSVQSVKADCYMTTYVIIYFDIKSNMTLHTAAETWKYLADKLNTKNLYSLLITLPHISLSLHIFKKHKIFGSLNFICTFSVQFLAFSTINCTYLTIRYTVWKKRNSLH